MTKSLVLLTAALVHVSTTFFSCQPSNADQKKGLVQAAEARASAGAAPLYREIADWIAACDNLHACTVKYVPDEAASAAAAGQDAAFLSIHRQAGPDAPVTIKLLSEARSPPSALSVDGAPLTPFGWRLVEDGSVLEGEAAQRFVARLRKGQLLTGSAAGGVLRVSLKGLTEALQAIDEDQGRLGTVAALARPGDAPANSAPPAPISPTVTAPRPRPVVNGLDLITAVRKSQAAVLKAHGCNPGQIANDSAGGLSETQAIVVLDCRTAAYQGVVLAFRADRKSPGRASLLVLPPPPVLDRAELSAAKGEYIEGAYDEARASFSETAKGRGLADCGHSATWTFDGGEFRLTALDFQNRCGGVPGDWTTLYRAEVRSGG